MNTQLQKVRQEALMLCAPVFHKMEEISLFNMQKVLEAFRKNHLSAYHFAPSNGYGYGDPGREKLEDVWCDIFHAEASLVRPQFVSGTHALATVLLALLNPGDTMVSAVGSPYDTMQSVIGITGDAPGNLKKRGVRYKEVPLKGNAYDLDAIAAAVDENVKLVEIQRSRGYMLIKNAGGGFAPTGAYICGKADLVELCAHAWAAPGLGSEMGSYAASYRPFFEGLFMAPHVTRQAMMSAEFCSSVFKILGFSVTPEPGHLRTDLITAITLDTEENMCRFAEAVQSWSPVDSDATPIPGPMPGYVDPIIMAAGTFVQGSTIEMSIHYVFSRRTCI